MDKCLDIPRTGLTESERGFNVAKGRPARVNRSRPYKVGNRMLSDYDVGWDLWYTRKPLPLNAPRAMQQGYVKAAKSSDASTMASARTHARRGMFVFLPGYEYLAADSGKPLSSGCESRYAVRVARAEIDRVREIA